MGERIQLQNGDLLPYPVGHLVMPSHRYGGVTYSSPTLAAFVDAIAAQTSRLKP